MFTRGEASPARSQRVAIETKFTKRKLSSLACFLCSSNTNMPTGLFLMFLLHLSPSHLHRSRTVILYPPATRSPPRTHEKLRSHYENNVNEM